jgi:hypothetical protein
MIIIESETPHVGRGRARSLTGRILPTFTSDVGAHR